MTCKDCIYKEACNQHLDEINNPKFTCATFKDRSKFVDVSELQQNVIRPLTNRCAAYTKCLTCLACSLEIRERCEHYKKVEKALNGSEKE